MNSITALTHVYEKQLRYQGRSADHDQDQSQHSKPSGNGVISGLFTVLQHTNDDGQT